MRLFSRILTVALALTAGSAIASASTITIESYGSLLNNGTANTFVGSNSALSFTAYNVGNGFVAPSSTATYNLPTTYPWSSLANASSSWVSFNPGAYPGGSYVAPSGDYRYTTTFAATSTSIGTITILADDTTSLYLNNVLITPAAPAVSGPNCTASTPNCLTSATYNLSGFINGTNTLTFGVRQDFGSATGLDFTGTIASTPEPSSLVFLATGLVGAAGAIRRRIKA